MPRQLPTNRPVMASALHPIVCQVEFRARWQATSGDSKGCVSTAKNPARYFLMAERDMRDKWKQITNAYIIWCVRHRGYLAATQALKHFNRCPHRAERAMHVIRNRFFWSHSQGHFGAGPSGRAASSSQAELPAHRPAVPAACPHLQ